MTPKESDMEFRLPELGEGVYEAEFGGWTVNIGDTIRAGQTLAEVSTDKAVMEIPAPFSGTINSLHAESGAVVKVGDVILTYTGVDQAPEDGAETRATPTATQSQPSGAAKVSQPAPRPSASNAKSSEAATTPEVGAAPSVRFMARKLGIDLTSVHGTGPGGRILIDDLAAQVSPSNGAEHRPRAERPTDYGTPGTRLKFQGVRKKIAEHLVHAKQTIPHYTYVDECDLTDLVKIRESLRDHAAQSGIKLTYLPFFVRAAVAALKEIPIVNSSLDENAGEIVFHDRYDIGIATATPQGLLVPVVRKADQLDLFQLAREIERLSNLARTGKAQRDDLRGSTFTITSIGGIGGLLSTPVINHPEVAILGIGKVARRPVYDPAGSIRPADMVYLSLSFDHRVVDGAVGAVFANAMIRYLQRPALLLLPPTSHR